MIESMPVKLSQVYAREKATISVTTMLLPIPAKVVV